MCLSSTHRCWHCFELINEKKIFSKTFDIIFLDPPYKYKNINVLIEQIIEKKILKKTGIILIHRHKKDVVNISDKITVIEQRVYGISKIIFGY